MEQEEIKIKDESGDRKYWTQIPNYIANHSTANDQALYFQMKRYAGEDGQCFATEKTLMKKLGIGKKAYNKSLQYLLDRKWIRFVGMTNGKTRPIKTYSIVDIWKLNIMEYEKINAESTLSSNKEISAESEGDKCQKHYKISARSTIEEEPTLRRTIKKNHTADLKIGRVKNNIELLTDYFLELKDWNDQPKEFYKKNDIRYSRFLKPAKDLLELCDNNLDRAKEKLLKTKEWVESFGGEEWAIETAIRKFLEIK